MTHQDWQATTSKETLLARAELLGQIRRFFNSRQVMEVDTPILSAAAGTDPALDPLNTQLQNAGNKAQDFYLQTSPEFAMKRLLASGSGAIYQLAKSFRNNESGKKHNPEFTMLEWYRPGYALTDLMDEVEDLLIQLLSLEKPQRISYSALFLRHLSIDPLDASLESLQKVAKEKVDVSMDSDNPDHWLDLLFSHCIEPELLDPVFITHYPPTQAALARIEEDEQGRPVALRFELLAGGMELANGYYELTDAQEQRKRFERDQNLREQDGLSVNPLDENFLSALEHGLTDCSGVAVGVDRLLMLKTGAMDIRQVIAFPVDIA